MSGLVSMWATGPHEAPTWGTGGQGLGGGVRVNRLIRLWATGPRSLQPGGQEGRGVVWARVVGLPQHGSWGLVQQGSARVVQQGLVSVLQQGLVKLDGLPAWGVLGGCSRLLRQRQQWQGPWHWQQRRCTGAKPLVGGRSGRVKGLISMWATDRLPQHWPLQLLTPAAECWQQVQGPWHRQCQQFLHLSHEP